MDGIVQRLAELLALPANRVRVNTVAGDAADSSIRPDLLVRADKLKLAMAWKSSGQAAGITMAIHSIRTFVENSREKFIPLVVAPFN